MSVNVNREVTDNFYRYKMPKLVAKVEGKGNGIKTVLVNLVDIAKALGRPPSYPCKYFGCELGAQTQMDLKAERFIVNGSHEANRLQDMLDGFIRRFVLCPNCDNPETDLVPCAKKKINRVCKACGHQQFLENTHKLCTFIINHPPEINSKTGPVRSERKKKTGSDDGSADDDNASVEQNGGDNYEHNEEHLVNQDWSEDTSAAAVAKRMSSLSKGAKELTLLDSNLEKTQVEKLELFNDFVKEKKDKNEVLSNIKLIFMEANKLDVKDKACLVLVSALFTDQVVNEIEKYRPLFLRFCYEKVTNDITRQNQRAMRYVLGGLEQLVAKHSSMLLPRVASIFKAFYDNDILSEEVLTSWAAKPTKKYVSRDMALAIHEKAAPLIAWLAEAEEESSDDEDDNEEVNVEFSKTSMPYQIKQARIEEPTVQDDGEEINIDDI